MIRTAIVLLALAIGASAEATEGPAASPIDSDIDLAELKQQLKASLKEEINGALKDGTLQPEDLNDPDTVQNKMTMRALKGLSSGAGLDDVTQLKARQPAAGMKSNADADQQDAMSAPELEEQQQLIKGMMKEEINQALKDGTLQPEDLNDPDTVQNKMAFRALKSLSGGAGLDDAVQLKARQPPAGMKSNVDQQDVMSAPDADSSDAVAPPPLREDPDYVNARGDDAEIPPPEILPPQREDQLPPNTSMSAAAVPSSMSIPLVALMGAFAGFAATFALFRPRPETPSDYQILVA